MPPANSTSFLVVLVMISGLSESVATIATGSHLDSAATIYFGGFSHSRKLQQLSADEEAELAKCEEVATPFISANPSLQDAATALGSAASSDLSSCMEQFSYTNDIICDIDYVTSQGGTPYGSYKEACGNAGGTLIQIEGTASCSSAPYSMTVTSTLVFCLPPDDACDPETMQSLLEKSATCTLGATYTESGARIAHEYGLICNTSIVLTISLLFGTIQMII
jgi:hypothetical protein